MHLLVLVAIFTIAWLLRYTRSTIDARSVRVGEAFASAKAAACAERLRQRHHPDWQTTLVIFLLPPLLLITSALAIIWMGPHGRMVWMGNDWLSYDLAIGFLGYAIVNLLVLASSGWQMLRQIRTYPIVTLGDRRVRLLDLDTPYSAQIGFWEPELVITTGLIDTLTPDRLEAVLAHERAHYHYRDTWYFFWLGWLRQMTGWLPQTATIWQDLTMLRELRADRWAADRTDPLLVAEALLAIVQTTPIFAENICAAFSQTATADRLTQRITALLDRPTLTPDVSATHHYAWAWLLLALLPFLTIPFHTQ